MTKCIDCGSSCVVKDSDSIIVCANCGEVLQEHLYIENSTFKPLPKSGAQFVSQGSRLTRNISTRATYFKTSRVKDMVNRFGHVLDRFNLQPNIDEIIEVLEMIYNTRSEQNAKKKMTNLTVMAVIYLITRRRSLPVTLTELASAAPCNKYDLGKNFFSIVRELRLPPFEPEPIMFLPRLCQSKYIKDMTLGSKVEKRAEWILNYVKRFWIASGRRSDVSAACACLISYESYSGSKSKTLELQKVYSQVFRCSISTMKKRFKEMVDCLFESAKILPWIQLDPKLPMSVLIDDIQKNSFLLQITASPSAPPARIRIDAKLSERLDNIKYLMEKGTCPNLEIEDQIMIETLLHRGWLPSDIAELKPSELYFHAVDVSLTENFDDLDQYIR